MSERGRAIAQAVMSLSPASIAATATSTRSPIQAQSSWLPGMASTIRGAIS